MSKIREDCILDIKLKELSANVSSVDYKLTENIENSIQEYHAQLTELKNKADNLIITSRKQWIER
jgi:conjugal transfer/entry exclusion protein